MASLGFSVDGAKKKCLLVGQSNGQLGQFTVDRQYAKWATLFVSNGNDVVSIDGFDGTSIEQETGGFVCANQNFLLVM